MYPAPPRRAAGTGPGALRVSDDVIASPGRPPPRRLLRSRRLPLPAPPPARGPSRPPPRCPLAGVPSAPRSQAAFVWPPPRSPAAGTRPRARPGGGSPGPRRGMVKSRSSLLLPDNPTAPRACACDTKSPFRAERGRAGGRRAARLSWGFPFPQIQQLISLSLSCPIFTEK